MKPQPQPRDSSQVCDAVAAGNAVAEAGVGEAEGGLLGGTLLPSSQPAVTDPPPEAALQPCTSRKTDSRVLFESNSAEATRCESAGAPKRVGKGADGAPTSGLSWNELAATGVAGAAEALAEAASEWDGDKCGPSFLTCPQAMPCTPAFPPMVNIPTVVPRARVCLPLLFLGTLQQILRSLTHAI
jgi:hypothetical protein